MSKSIWATFPPFVYLLMLGVLTLLQDTSIIYISERLHIAFVVVALFASTAAGGLALTLAPDRIGLELKCLAVAMLLSGSFFVLQFFPMPGQAYSLFALCALLLTGLSLAPGFIRPTDQDVSSPIARLIVPLTLLFLIAGAQFHAGFNMSSIAQLFLGMTATTLMAAGCFKFLLSGDASSPGPSVLFVISMLAVSSLLYSVAEPWDILWWHASAFHGLAQCILLLRLAGHLTESLADIETTHLLEATLDHSAADALITIDELGHIIRFNKGAELMFGYSKDEVLGCSVNILVPKELGIDHDALLARYDDTSDSAIVNQSRPLTGQRKSGETFPLMLSVSAFRSGGKQVFTSIIRDTTEQQRLYKSLLESKNRAEAGDKAKTEFLSVVSHELMTPLNGVIGMLSILERTGMDDKQQEKLTIASGCADRLLDTLKSILDLTELSTRRLQLKPRPFDLKALVDQIAVRAMSALGDKPVRVVLDSEGLGDVWVTGDYERVEQILWGLLDNAVKFTHQGEIRLNCRRVSQDAVAFEIEDTGVGFDDTLAVKLFEPFSQEDYTLTRDYEGLGLGLSIVSQLCELMEGQILVQSRIGEGTRFRVQIKLKPVEAVSELAAPKSDIKNELTQKTTPDANQEANPRTHQEMAKKFRKLN